MGFFSNLKNSLTGGWATVTLTPGEAVRGTLVPVTVNVLVKENPIQVARVYVKLECREEIEIPDYATDLKNADGSNTTRHTITVRQSGTLLQTETVLGTPGELNAGQAYTFEGKVEIPAELPPTCHGRYFRTRWRMLAGLDMKGNDPDSGWVDLELR